ncbi:rod shape-determining protein RodA [Thiothrix nivea]|uniref:Peptidoglycan glycosyltransferase MrdB n=1 Tax=Thiothrix nivea (strain ATCC 35100 / DSM 5205 / JP2) TaxID=870187 RepID=A0A656HJJ2_THINJ|nr:rod shape-determining protein RodA [Thiothrix nivea]EIJ35666.1 cell elongation-specific peptidoglycan biosynthesis regulator RodA [Thiothrix nivea DSM 5205]
MINGLLPSWLTIALQRVDAVLLAVLSLLVMFGLGTLYSASDANMDQVQRQIIHFLIGLGLLVIFSQISSKTLRLWSLWLYGIGVALLVLVLVIGVTKKGAQRWLNIGVDIQPAEIMKLAVPMMVAYYFSEKPLPPRFTDVLIALLLVFVPMLLIMKQPDLGTALLIATSGFFVIYLAGMSWWLIGGGAVLLSVAAPLLYFFGMHDYQRRRVDTLLNPESDLLGTGYHIYQSKIAIGSGGVYGKGWMNGDQSHLDFLPERHTDFIFAVFGEEFGLVGNLILMGLYLFIIWRGLYLASKGEDTFARLLGGGLSVSFFFYLFVNTGMVSGLLPVVGVPLPLVSYGGTSVVTLMMAFGIIMGMRKRKRIYQREG